MSDVIAHFKHARSLGTFSAEDCLRLAREAAALDQSAATRRLEPPRDVWREVLPDGSREIRLSSGVRCY